jgi:hypothetical protein
MVLVSLRKRVGVRQGDKGMKQLWTRMIERSKLCQKDQISPTPIGSKTALGALRVHGETQIYELVMSKPCDTGVQGALRPASC